MQTRQNLHLAFLTIALALITHQAASQNDAPIVGIVTLPFNGGGYNQSEWNYIAQSYVSFLESAGAQVVPIHWDLPTDQLDTLLSQLNGVLFTGGNTFFYNQTDNTPAYEAFQHIIMYVVNQNIAGNFYPLWGTCQGLQVMSRVFANNRTILTHCDNCQYVVKNNYPVATYQSKMLSTLPYDLQQKITYANLSTFDHAWKLDIDTFTEYPTLAGNVTPVAYSIDQAQVVYISMFESEKYPIYAAQFHQEKSTFEWNPTLNIAHQYDSIRFQHYLSNFFVQETTKNTNTFPQNQTYLIYNYNHTHIPNSDYDNVFLFPANNSTQSLNSQEPVEETQKIEFGFLSNDLIA